MASSCDTDKNIIVNSPISEFTVTIDKGSNVHLQPVRLPEVTLCPERDVFVTVEQPINSTTLNISGITSHDICSAAENNVHITPNETPSIVIEMFSSNVGLMDAPKNNALYGRKNGKWEIIVPNTTDNCDDNTGGGGVTPIPPTCPPAEVGIFVTDVTNSGTGIVGSKEYVANTVPPNSVISSASTDDNTVTIHILAESTAIAYSPVVIIDGSICTNLAQYSGDRRLFFGSVDVVVNGTRDITVQNGDSTTTVTIVRAAAAPDVLTAVIGSYPTGQTAAKQYDVVNVSGTTEPSATHVRLRTYGVFEESTWKPVQNGNFSFNGIVTDNHGTFAGMLEARNSLGSIGSLFTTDNQIILDQIAPSFTGGATTFPVGQTAFKGNETGSQTVTVNNYESLIYASPNNDFIISDPTLYNEDKNIACTNPGDYNDSSVNYRITASKASNGTSNVFNKVIEVADVAPIVTITQPISRLRSSHSGSDYLITANSNQNLVGVPDVAIPVSGSWTGNFSGSNKYFTNHITLTDGDAAGIADWTWNNVPVNKAGLSASIVGQESVGGFVMRNVALAAFATEATLNTLVTIPTKLRLTWSFKANMVFYPIGTPAPVVNGWTVNVVDNNPTTIIILDSAAANSSSQESVLAIEERV